jgi:hypothetical protein
MVAVYPAYLDLNVPKDGRASVSFLIEVVRIFLESCRKDTLPLTAILEYGYMDSGLFEKAKKDFPKCHFVQTGIMKNGCGIFLEDYDEKNILEHLHSLPAQVKALLGDDLIEKNRYLKTHALYLGYYNSDTSRAVNKHVNPLNYIHLIIESFQKDIHLSDKKYIDIMLPFGLEEMSKLNFDRINELGFSEVSYLSANGVSSPFAQNANSGPILRVIQLPKVTPVVYRSLVAIAEPFIMCTGDQSLSEVISKGLAEEGWGLQFGLPYYQIMHWKLNAFAELLDYITKVCGEKSHFTLVVKSVLVDVDTKLLGDVIGTGLICWDSQKFAAFVKRYFNLGANLPKYLEACIDANLMLEVSDVLPKPSFNESDYRFHRINNSVKVKFFPAFSGIKNNDHKKISFELEGIDNDYESLVKRLG